MADRPLLRYAFSFFLTIMLQCSVVPLVFGFTMDRVLVTVNEDVITLSDYQRYLKTIGRYQRGEQVDEALLKQLIEERVIVNEAVRRGMDVTPAELESVIREIRKEKGLSPEAFSVELSKEGLDYEGFKVLMREKLLVSRMTEAEVDSRVIVGEREVEEYYTAHKREYVGTPARVEVRAIHFKLHEGATVTEITDLKLKSLRIVERLKEGVHFELLAKEYSQGEVRLGEFERGAMIPQLDTRAFSMNRDDISEPLWVKDGVYIIKLINRKDEQYKSLEEARQAVYNDVFRQKRERIYSAWMKTLWEKASISIK